MFGFLKKKLKESIEKITKTVSEKEVKIEKIEETILQEEKKIENIKDIEEKKQLIEDSKTEITPDVEKILEDINKEAALQEIPKIEETKIEKIHHIEPVKKEIETPKEVKIEIEKITPVKEIVKEPPKEEKIGLLGKIKKALTEKKIEEEDIKEMLWDMQVSLIESDVATEVAEKIVNDLKNNLVGKSVKKSEVQKTVKDSLKKSVEDVLNVQPINFFEKVKSKKPFTIIFLGFNGAGKTTTIARVGKMLSDEGLKVVFAAADTWRAASIEQLEEHGKNLNIPVIKQKYGSDPAAVIFDAIKHAKSKDFDVVLADTAGRSHANTNLIEELKKICRVNTPDMKILVMDALTGNDIVDQSTVFNDAVGVDGMILTKVDVYEKGGALLSSVHNIKKPILFIGVGQDYDDMRVFDAEEIAQKLLE